MITYLIVTESFAAPFVSDRDELLVDAGSPRDALEQVAAAYTHPCGLYAAACYASAEAYHRREAPVVRWLSPDAAMEEERRRRESLGHLEANS